MPRTAGALRTIRTGKPFTLPHSSVASHTSFNLHRRQEQAQSPGPFPLSQALPCCIPAACHRLPIAAHSGDALATLARGRSSLPPLESARCWCCSRAARCTLRDCHRLAALPGVVSFDCHTLFKTQIKHASCIGIPLLPKSSDRGFRLTPRSPRFSNLGYGKHTPCCPVTHR